MDIIICSGKNARDVHEKRLRHVYTIFQQDMCGECVLEFMRSIWLRPPASVSKAK